MEEFQGVILGGGALVALISGALGFVIASQRGKQSAQQVTILNNQVVDKAKENEALNQQVISYQSQSQQLQLELGKLETTHQNQLDVHANLVSQKQALEEKLTHAVNDVQTLQTQQARLSEQVNASSERFNELSNRHQQQTEAFETIQKDHQGLTKQYAELDTQLQTKQQHFDEQLKLLQESKTALKQEFENLANDILDKKGDAFKKLNLESMSHILNPIQTELKGFKARVEDIHGKETEQRVQLRTELENLQKLNREITDQADKLTTALKGEKKVQGNWGELMLENVLDNSGLRLGTDYKREVSITSEEGRFRPDAIVYLPQNKHLVIDAKTSLNAYTRYVNGLDEETRHQAIKEHCQAVRDRLAELASKDYCKLPGINSPEVVVMFIPIESAYVEALKADEQLFQFALQNNILIATPTTLLTSLNIVRQLWRFEEQNKHTAELASRAEKFYNKLSTFLTSMQGVGNQLDKAKATYDKALGQLVSGPGNLVKQASEFKQLGVSVQKELPKELTDRAELELGHDELSSPKITASDSNTVE